MVPHAIYLGDFVLFVTETCVILNLILVKIFKCRKTFLVAREIYSHITSVSNVNTICCNEIQQRTLTQTLIIQSYNYIPYSLEKLWEYIKYIYIIQKIKPLGARIIFLILAHTVYKMWIIQEPNMLELWNELHFEEKKTESIHHV
jgi:hypothetical protein